MELEQPIRTSVNLKCKHTKCSRPAHPNEDGYCEDCIQLEHLTVCNYCSEVIE